MFSAIKDSADRRKVQAAVCLKDKPDKPNGGIDGVWGRHTKQKLEQCQCRMGRIVGGNLAPALKDDLLSFGLDDIKAICSGR